uniref:Uncharacterized protein n=1 Tax=Kalanchoe fedtschenkoi TaxID=63787 RepID=A0A7N0U729_KALFE
MERGGAYRSGSRIRFSSSDRLAALGLALLGVVSPLFIDRRQVIVLEEDEPVNFASWLPVLLLILLIAIIMSRCLDRGFTRFDPNWIHRVGGSSVGIVATLIILASILKFKASMRNWEA